MSYSTSQFMQNALQTADRNEIKALFYKLSALSNSKNLTREERIILSKTYLVLKQITELWKEDAK